MILIHRVWFFNCIFHHFFLGGPQHLDKEACAFMSHLRHPLCRQPIWIIFCIKSGWLKLYTHMKIQTNLVIKNTEIFHIKRYHIIYCAVISGENVRCRLRSFCDRQTFLLVRAIFTAYTCSPWESGIWYEGMPPGMALAAREEEAGLGGI